MPADHGVRLNATARWERTGRLMGPERPGAVFGPETFVEHIGDDALAPLAAAADSRRERPERPARGGPRRPGIAATRAGETMMRAVAVFVGREI